MVADGAADVGNADLEEGRGPILAVEPETTEEGSKPDLALLGAEEEGWGLGWGPGP